MNTVEEELRKLPHEAEYFEVVITVKALTRRSIQHFLNQVHYKREEYFCQFIISPIREKHVECDCRPEGEVLGW